MIFLLTCILLQFISFYGLLFRITHPRIGLRRSMQKRNTYVSKSDTEISTVHYELIHIILALHWLLNWAKCNLNLFVFKYTWTKNEVSYFIDRSLHGSMAWESIWLFSIPTSSHSFKLIASYTPCTFYDDNFKMKQYKNWNII